jgi:hypothetical protein
VSSTLAVNALSAYKKIYYGPCETLIMRKCIAALEKASHIHQMHDGEW